MLKNITNYPDFSLLCPISAFITFALQLLNVPWFALCLTITLSYLFLVLVLDSKAIDSNQPMNALMRLNQIRPGLQYRLLSQSGPVHAPVFTMSVDLDGTVYEASGSSKKTAKLHVAVKVSLISVFDYICVFMFFKHGWLEM